ncbi:MAG: DUF433 domain-containing protein [Thermodesulfobacteriota bacterium]|nr:DUF433 domain-containing protein [Thermodesulfobacteriota bacterium]
MTQLERIAIDPKIMHGKPCVKGTRIPVYIVLNLLAGGMSEKEILENYPDLEMDDIHACIGYGAILAEEEVGILEASHVV